MNTKKCKFCWHKSLTKKKIMSPCITPLLRRVTKRANFFLIKKIQSSHTIPYNCREQFSGIHVKSVKSKHDEEFGNAQRKYDLSNQYT